MSETEETKIETPAETPVVAKKETKAKAQKPEKAAKKAAETVAPVIEKEVNEVNQDTIEPTVEASKEDVQFVEAEFVAPNDAEIEDALTPGLTASDDRDETESVPPVVATEPAAVARPQRKPTPFDVIRWRRLGRR